MKSVQHDAYNLFYADYGSGFPVVLVHGLAEDHNVWNDVAGELKNSMRLLIPDLPGWGKSELPSDLKSMNDFADAVYAILKAEHIDECVMIGHSMGGYITLAFAEKYSDMLAGFGLFQSSALADDETKKQNRDKVADFVIRIGVAPYINELYDTLFSKSYYQTQATQLADLKKYAAQFSAETIRASVLAMKNRPDRTEVLKQSEVPVLFVIGDEDGTAPPEKVLPQTFIPRFAEVFWLNNCGHMGHIEYPYQSAKFISTFINNTVLKNQLLTKTIQ